MPAWEAGCVAEIRSSPSAEARASEEDGEDKEEEEEEVGAFQLQEQRLADRTTLLATPSLLLSLAPSFLPP